MAQPHNSTYSVQASPIRAGFFAGGHFAGAINVDDAVAAGSMQVSASAFAGALVAGDAVAAGPMRGTPAWLAADMTLFKWLEIEGTALSSAAPSPPSLGDPSAQIYAWCGACVDTDTNDYYIGAAGGHADYAGNQVNRLRLQDDAPNWTMPRPPSANSDILDLALYYLDGRPAATHSYWGTLFVRSRRKLIIMPAQGLAGLGATPPVGWAYPDSSVGVRSYDVAAGDWDLAPGVFDDFPGTGQWTACLIAQHPITEDVYYRRNGGTHMWRLNVNAGDWTAVSGGFNPSEWYAGAAIDPTRDRMLIVGGFTPIAPRVMSIVDGSEETVTFGGLGAGPITVGGYPGVLYIPPLDAYLVVQNGAGGTITVHTVDAATFEVNLLATTGTPPANRLHPVIGTGGIVNSCQWLPSLGCIVIANSYTGNMYRMRIV